MFGGPTRGVEAEIRPRASALDYFDRAPAPSTVRSELADPLSEGRAPK